MWTMSLLLLHVFFMTATVGHPGSFLINLIWIVVPMPYKQALQEKNRENPGWRLIKSTPIREQSLFMADGMLKSEVTMQNYVP